MLFRMSGKKMLTILLSLRKVQRSFFHNTASQRLLCYFTPRTFVTTAAVHREKCKKAAGFHLPLKEKLFCSFHKTG